MVKKLPASVGDARDPGSIPGWGRSPGGGNGHPLQYSCRGAHSPGGHKESDTTELTGMHTRHQSNGKTRFLKITAPLVSGTKKKALHFTGGFQIWFSLIIY